MQFDLDPLYWQNFINERKEARKQETKIDEKHKRKRDHHKGGDDSQRFISDSRSSNGSHRKRGRIEDNHNMHGGQLLTPTSMKDVARPGGDVPRNHSKAAVSDEDDLFVDQARSLSDPFTGNRSDRQLMALCSQYRLQTKDRALR